MAIVGKGIKENLMPIFCFWCFKVKDLLLTSENQHRFDNRYNLTVKLLDWNRYGKLWFRRLNRI